MNVLVTGGAGYIGSHAVKQLVEAGHKVVVIDNLSRGHRGAIAEGARFYELSIGDTANVIRVLSENETDCVMHFAALAYVGESVDHPLEYYENNTAGAVSVLQAMKVAGVKRFIFSSTCATYGQPGTTPINENAPQQPINPYGRSKYYVEQILRDASAADPEFSFIALRYFNVAGAAADGLLGEDHRPETHLVPILLQAALGQRNGVTVFGTDYPTPDGTCIRDYIHVEDLCAAHILAMEALKPGYSEFYNLGIGRGYSVREVVESVQRVTGTEIAIHNGVSRPGDPAELYADSTKIQDDLGWEARYTEIDDIVDTAWNWHMKHPNGYDERDGLTRADFGLKT